MTGSTISFAEEMNNNEFCDIPFFQRKYVWDTDNWDELLEELSENKREHFLGSYIVKDDGYEGNIRRKSIVDGQQRFTTLSVLLKVCYDICVGAAETADIRSSYEIDFNRLMTISAQRGGGRKLKLRHSLVDGPAFSKIMGFDSHVKILSGRIIKCAEHFHKKLDDNPDTAKRLFDTLVGDSCRMVVIRLDKDDDEQGIFDTINSAGVRLSSADIIKNALFQRLKELCTEDETKEIYRAFWTELYDADETAVAYWNEGKTQGRVTRSNLELLLQCVAVIEGIYDPNKSVVGKLADCYKKHITSLDREGVENLVREIAEYAKLYRDVFGRVDKTAEYVYADDRQRLIHILAACDISTFDPLVLKMLKEDPPNDDGNISGELKQRLKKLESYVLRSVVAGASVKNYNKECEMILSGKKTIDDFFAEKVANGEMADEMVRQGLRHISNKHAKIVLFWLELKYRAEHDAIEVKKLLFKPELEHVMPQKWEENWPTAVVPVVSVDDGSVIADIERQKAVRNSAIYEIGNMTLLKKHLNDSISNGSLQKKIEGDGRKPGVKKYNDYFCTRDVVETATVEGGYHWDEKTIRDRTVRISEEFLTEWGA